MRRIKILITGVSGLLGNNLAMYLSGFSKVMGLYHHHAVSIPRVLMQKCDLCDSDEVSNTVNEFDPDVIIHCASLTNIDQCEETRDNTNIITTENIIGSIQPSCYVVHISTDSVYDGVKGYFDESDPTFPCNYYGKTKLDSESLVLNHENSLVLRTNIFGWNIQDKQSIGEWILAEFDAKRSINGFNDAKFSSIYTFEIARIIEQAIDQKLKGVFNCASRNNCSKYEFALKIAEQFNLDKSLIKSISIDDHRFKARRGKNLSLNVTKLETTLDTKLPTIESSIEQFYRDYQCGLPARIKDNSNIIDSGLCVIPYGRQMLDDSDIESVVSVMHSKNLTQGPKVKAFEDKLAELIDAKYAIAVNSGTSALHIACLAAGVGIGDEVITSPNTFVASANCAVYCGATPVFADIDPRSYNIAPSELEKRITSKTKAVIPVHFAGQSADMEQIYTIVKSAEKKYGHKINIIEDASHALGSMYLGHQVGSSQFSDMTVLSFHPVKHITTAEGGAVVTSSQSLSQKLRLFASHGITRDEDLLNENLGPWYYEQVALGYNYRITDIQCALGISQLRKLPFFMQRRRNIVDRYNQAFNNIPYVTIPFESEDCDSNFHLYVILIDFEQNGTTRNSFKEELEKNKILTQIHYVPVHTQPFYQKTFHTGWGDCPNAETYFQHCLSLPLYPAMSNENVETVIDAVKTLLNGGS